MERLITEKSALFLPTEPEDPASPIGNPGFRLIKTGRLSLRLNPLVLVRRLQAELTVLVIAPGQMKNLAPRYGSARGSVALADRRTCGILVDRAARSDRQGEFVEYRGKPSRRRRVGSEFVVTTSQILNERVPPDHDTRGQGGGVEPSRRSDIPLAGHVHIIGLFS